MTTIIPQDEADRLRAMAAEHAAEDRAKKRRECRCDACHFARHGEIPTNLSPQNMYKSN